MSVSMDSRLPICKVSPRSPKLCIHLASKTYRDVGICIFFLFSLFWASPCYADSLVDAAKLLKKGKCNDGLVVLNSLIDDGSSDALYLLGAMYHDGMCVEKDKLKSIDIMESLSGNDFIDAHTYLGLMFYKGDGVGKNIDTAMFYYNKAAVHDDAFAEYCIGAAYYNKSWSQYSPEQGIRWFKKSALKGYDKSCSALYKIYKDGMGVEINDHDARYWRRLCE